MVSLESKTTPDLQCEHMGALIATHAKPRMVGPEQGPSHHGLLRTHLISASPCAACPKQVGRTPGRFVRIFNSGEQNAAVEEEELQLLYKQQTLWFKVSVRLSASNLTAQRQNNNKKRAPKESS